MAHGYNKESIKEDKINLHFTDQLQSSNAVSHSFWGHHFNFRALPWGINQPRKRVPFVDQSSLVP